MKKLLVVGVIVLFLGLACAPSINALQLDVIENKIKKEYEELLLNNDINFVIPDKFPMLYLLVFSILMFRNFRGFVLFDLAFEVDYWGVPHLKHPLLLLRGLVLWATVDWGIYGWYLISEILGWDWDFGLDG